MMEWLFDRRYLVLNLILLGGAVMVRFKSPFEPIVWEDATDLPVLEGKLARNDRLVATDHLHEGEVVAPEALAIGSDGYVYTGLADGRVVRLDANGENPVDIFFTGGFVSEAGRAVDSANGLDYGSYLLESCKSKAQVRKLKLADEKECGRPLGVRWRAPQKLYILDAYHGLFELDLGEGGRARQLINALTDTPLALGRIGPTEVAAAGAPAKEVELPMVFLNDLLFTKEGTILITDSSWKNPRAFNRREMADGAPRGRLLRYDPSSGDLRTVMCGLHFPNGLEFDRTGTKLLLVESMRFRLLEIDLVGLLAKDPQSTEAPPSAVALSNALRSCEEGAGLPDGVKIFAEALPGFVDGIHYNEKLGGYVCAAGSKVASPFSLLHLSLKLPGWFRILLGKLVPIEVIEKLVPRYGIVVIYGEDGSVVDSLHDPTGRTAFISSAHRHPESGYMFLGSSQNPYLGRVRI